MTGARLLGLLGLVAITAAARPGYGGPPPRRQLWPSTRPEKTATSRPISRPRVGERTGAARTYRRAVGALGAALCYHAYRSIKGAADGLVRRIYRRGEIRKQMTATRRTLIASRAQLQAIARLRLEAVDRLALRQIVGALEQLIVTSEALGAYATSKAKRDFGRFELRRRAAWRQLKRLLEP